MKLCQRCANEAGMAVLGFEQVFAIAGVEIVPEADCQQWAHKELIRVRVIAQKDAKEVDDRIFRDLNRGMH